MPPELLIITVINFRLAGHDLEIMKMRPQKMFYRWLDMLSEAITMRCFFNQGRYGRVMEIGDIRKKVMLCMEVNSGG